MHIRYFRKCCMHSRDLLHGKNGIKYYTLPFAYYMSHFKIFLLSTQKPRRYGSFNQNTFFFLK